MRHTILRPEYEARFVDTMAFPPSTPFQLRGLAAALQDAACSWAPTVSQLAEVLRPADNKDELMACGSAYGAAKQIGDIYPGPGILLYGAIVNRLFQEDDAELCRSMERARSLIVKADLESDADIMKVFAAADQRAKMVESANLCNVASRAGCFFRAYMTKHDRPTWPIGSSTPPTMSGTELSLTW